jgi:hypothetical protein
MFASGGRQASLAELLHLPTGDVDDDEEQASQDDQDSRDDQDSQDDSSEDESDGSYGSYDSEAEHMAYSETMLSQRPSLFKEPSTWEMDLAIKTIAENEPSISHRPSNSRPESPPSKSGSSVSAADVLSRHYSVKAHASQGNLFDRVKYQSSGTDGDGQDDVGPARRRSSIDVTENMRRRSSVAGHFIDDEYFGQGTEYNVFRLGDSTGYMPRLGMVAESATMTSTEEDDDSRIRKLNSQSSLVTGRRRHSTQANAAVVISREQLPMSSGGVELTREAAFKRVSSYRQRSLRRRKQQQAIDEDPETAELTYSIAV